MAMNKMRAQTGKMPKATPKGNVSSKATPLRSPIGIVRGGGKAGKGAKPEC